MRLESIRPLELGLEDGDLRRKKRGRKKHESKKKKKKCALPLCFVPYHLSNTSIIGLFFIYNYRPTFFLFIIIGLLI